MVHGVEVVPVLLLSLSLLLEMSLLFHVEFRDSNIKRSPDGKILIRGLTSQAVSVKLESGGEVLQVDVVLGQ